MEGFREKPYQLKTAYELLPTESNFRAVIEMTGSCGIY